MRPGLNYLRALKRVWTAAAFERKYFCSADTCLFVSEVDAAVFSRLCPATRVEVIPNGVDADYFRPGPGRPRGDLLVFEGSMDFPPNADAAVHFCRDILPLIRARRDAVSVCLVGKRPLPRVQALASDIVTVTGFVDDVRPYLSDAAVFVCPLRSGAGIKNKILQAWAMGKAVVATPESTGGLRCKEGENILVRESPRQFADAVVGLLADPDRCSRLGERARKTIEAHYTWQAKAGQLEALMGDLRAPKQVRYANA
jgi:glycosyltransferase involved in cell wall biosynthesis